MRLRIFTTARVSILLPLRGESSQAIDLSAEAKGIYFIQAEDQDGTVCFIIIVQRGLEPRLPHYRQMCHRELGQRRV
jgi:hypothetical protein